MGIRNTVNEIVNNSTGHSVEELQALRATLSERAETDEQALNDLHFVEGYLEAPGALLADLAAIARKHQQ